MYINQLNKIVNSYDNLRIIAENIVWLDINERRFYWNKKNNVGISEHLYDFTKNYVKDNFENAYVCAVLGRMGANEEFDKDFWKISFAEREHLLTAGLNWYGAYMLYKQLRMKSVTEKAMLGQIKNSAVFILLKMRLLRLFYHT